MATKPKQDSVRERVYLTFPKDLIKEPVLSMLAKRFDIATEPSPKPSPGVAGEGEMRVRAPALLLAPETAL